MCYALFDFDPMIAGDVSVFNIMGRGAERRQWRMKRRRKRSEQQVQAPLQGVCTPIANLTEQAKRSETWFESNCHHHNAALVNQGL